MHLLLSINSTSQLNTRYMFKAKLIEDKRFYTLQSRQIILAILPLVFLGLIVFEMLGYHLGIPLWAKVLLFVLYLLSLLLEFRNNKAVNKTLGQRIIEITDREVSIFPGIKHHTDRFPISKDTEILVLNPDKRRRAEMGIKEMAKTARGKGEKQYIVLTQPGDPPQRFDFITESRFMEQILVAIIEQWRKKGIKVEVR